MNEQPKPGYLITLHDKDAYFGGIMVTDNYGIPKDFKYTDPVVPTKVQRIIYGEVLERYIRNHVIVGALSKDASVQPSFYIVSHHELHDIEEANASLALVALQRTQLPPFPEKGAVKRAKEQECLIQGWLDTHPLRVTFGQMMPDAQESVLKDLTYLSRTMDLLEPITRLEHALKDICREQL